MSFGGQWDVIAQGLVEMAADGATLDLLDLGGNVIASGLSASKEDYEIQERGNTQVQIGLFKLNVAAVSIPAGIDWVKIKVRYGGVVYQVLTTTPTGPGLDPCMLTVHVQ